MAHLKYHQKFKGYWRKSGLKYIPKEPGVYCVYTCSYNEKTKRTDIQTLVYFGGTEDMLERISRHEKWNEWENYVKDGYELCFSYSHVDSKDRERIEAALIYHHKPPANEEQKKLFPYDTTTLYLEGDIKLLDKSFTVYRTN